MMHGGAAPVQGDDGCDLLIAGSGAAGLTAAVTACLRGLRPLVIEKSRWVGGTTALSEGMAWVPLSQQAREAGIADSAEQAVRYLEAAAGPFFDRPRASAYVEQAHRMLAFLERHSHVRFELVRGSIDYRPDLPGSLNGGRALRPALFDGRRLGPAFARLRPPLATTMLFGGLAIASADLPHYFALRRSPAAWWQVARLLLRYGADRLRGWPRGTRLGNGNGLVAALLLSLQEHAVPVRTETRLVALQHDGERIAGAWVEQAGRRRLIRARAGVLLATGGFSADAALRARHFGHVAAGQNHVRLAPESNTGDGWRAACACGAGPAPPLSNPAAWSPVSLVPQPDGAAVPFPHYLDRGKPGIIAVDRRGRRFTNEAACYHDFVQAMVAAHRDDPRIEAYLVADHRALRRYGLGAVPPAPGRIAAPLRSGYLRRADSLDELGARLGLPDGALAQTVAQFNTAAARGHDDAFGRGGDAYQRAAGDPQHGPNPSLGALRTPPFYAVRIEPGDIATFAGLPTDGQARVLAADGSPIPGLYAAGNDMASVMGGSYPGAGITVGSAMTFGHVAAWHAADYL